MLVYKRVIFISYWHPGKGKHPKKDIEQLSPKNPFVCPKNYSREGSTGFLGHYIDMAEYIMAVPQIISLLSGVITWFYRWISGVIILLMVGL